MFTGKKRSTSKGGESKKPVVQTSDNEKNQYALLARQVLPNPEALTNRVENITVKGKQMDMQRMYIREGERTRREGSEEGLCRCYIIHDLAMKMIVKSRFTSKDGGETGCFDRSG